MLHVWMPMIFVYRHRFEKQVQYLDEHPEIDILGSNALLFNDGQTDKATKVSTLPLLDKDIKSTFFFSSRQYH